MKLKSVCVVPEVGEPVREAVIVGGSGCVGGSSGGGGVGSGGGGGSSGGGGGEPPPPPPPPEGGVLPPVPSSIMAAALACGIMLTFSTNQAKKPTQNTIASDFIVRLMKAFFIF